MKRTTKGLRLLLASIVISASFTISATAQAGGNISIPLPPLPPLPPIPQIKLPAPPLMVWLPIPMVYVAMDSPYPIFCHENHYYLHSNNVWYVGPGYAGPWTITQISLLPPGLHHFHGHEWKHYQHDARYWQHHNQQGHPYFYGNHHGEPRETHASPSQKNERLSLHEQRTRSDNRWPHNRQIAGHAQERGSLRNTRHDNIYASGQSRNFSLSRSQNTTLDQHRSESRNRGHNHRRMSY